MTRVSMSRPSWRARCCEQLQHDRRLVGRQDLRAEARRRDAESPATGRDIEEPHAGTQPGATEALLAPATYAWA